jgi:hypothetical protein
MYEQALDKTAEAPFLISGHRFQLFRQMDPVQEMRFRLSQQFGLPPQPSVVVALEGRFRPVGETLV